MAKPRYSTVKEVAQRLSTPGQKVWPQTVRNWCRDGLVLARLTPGDEWRVEVDVNGWPLEPVPVDGGDLEEEYETEE